MEKYPFVYFLRDDSYNEIDILFESNKNNLQCTIEIISLKEIKKLNNMFDSNYHLLVTYGDENIYTNYVLSVIANRMRNRWIHIHSFDNITTFNNSVNYCYVNNLIQNREDTRPLFSIFTTCYKSYEKIYRAFKSILSQTLIDWEWVILDDSPEDEHFNFLRELSKQDKRIRLYKRHDNSGNIGNVKNEVVGLCRGKYVLEMDHDDIILPKILKEAYDVFERYDEIGFIYADFANIYEDGTNFSYGDFFGKGYAGYYMEKFNNHWFRISSCPCINNITTSHLVCLPNHPRMWRRKILLELGNYSEFLPVCDDFEILLRTMCNTKVAKIHKLGYIQYMNDNNNNFSLIRNEEINRLGPQWIQPIFYQKYNVNENMMEKDAHENTKYITDHSQIWKRDKTWKHKISNILINPDYDKQYCLIGFNHLYNEKIRSEYQNKRNDFMVLDNTITTEELINKIESLGYSRMKCYSLLNTTDEELMNYFCLICKYTDNYEIIYEDSKSNK
jgi:glycosyltransferase involved in cell wall biosynthesis